MLLDMLAAVAGRDYEQRRERQQQGIAGAKGRSKGRRVNQSRYDAINRLIASGSSTEPDSKVLGCSRATISKAVKQQTVNKMNHEPEGRE